MDNKICIKKATKKRNNEFLLCLLHHSVVCAAICHASRPNNCLKEQRQGFGMITSMKRWALVFSEPLGAFLRFAQIHLENYRYRYVILFHQIFGSNSSSVGFLVHVI